MFEWHKKEKPILSVSGFGGGAGGLSFGGVNPINLPFSATGGVKTGPTGGYYYHTFDSPDTFIILSGISQVEVAVTGGGGAGGSGGPPGGDEAGAGGGGAGTGIYTIGELIPGNYSVTVGQGAAGAGIPPTYNPGGSGGNSSFSGPPTYPGSVSASGGNGSTWYNNTPATPTPSGSWPASPTFTTNNAYPGGGGENGDNRPADPSRNYGPINGGYGGDAGHYNNPGWWSPFLGTGKGGWSPSPWPTGKSGYSLSASPFGGGGGGGVRGGSGGAGANGRIVVRYPDAV